MYSFLVFSKTEKQDQISHDLQLHVVWHAILRVLLFSASAAYVGLLLLVDIMYICINSAVTVGAANNDSTNKYQSDINHLTDYLRCLYSNLIPTQTSIYQWPPSPTPRVFEITMIKNKPDPRRPCFNTFVRLSVKGKLDNIQQERSLIKLQEIFKELKGKRKIVLLEGAPGSGKSTLSRYICQQWSKKLLFQEYELVILVQLRQLKCHSTLSFVDLLPEQYSHAVKRLIANGGQGVLFILDGWDELSSPLRRQQNSIFHRLIQQADLHTNPLYKSDVILTSRPICSGDLFHNISLHIELVGFSHEELDRYFTECLEGDTKALETLKREIKENPEIAENCYLPLDASMLVYIFKKNDYSLPKTQQNYIAEFIRHCIFRHIQERGPSNLRTASLPPLDQLPDDIKQPFQCVCKLAFDGVVRDEVIFTDLTEEFNTLGLLQGIERADCGWKVSYNFLHLSIQEFMAAFYIASLPEDKQVSILCDLFSSESSRFVAVVKFYAAITKLKTSGVSALLVKIAIECGVERPKKRDKILLCSLICCLYEAHDISLCELIAHHLQYGLDLSCITLNSKECLSIGYFLYCVCKTTSKEFKVDLGWCSIDDQGCYYLISYLCKCGDIQTGINAVLNVKLRNNRIYPQGVKHLSKLIRYTIKLNLIMNQHISDEGTSYIVKELKNNKTLKTLNLQDCGLTSKGAGYLACALTTNSSLENLYIGVNNLGDVGIHHIALALEHNHSLKRLRLVTCNLTDVGLGDLACSLQQNRALKELYIRSYLSEYRNTITDKGIDSLKTYLKNNTTLTMLVLPKDNEMFTNTIQEAVNETRKMRGLPVIEVKGQSLYSGTSEIGTLYNKSLYKKHCLRSQKLHALYF